MADPRKRLAINVAGEFFVDSTCIDCDTCRQLAPAVFAEGDEYAFVHAQPETVTDRRAAFRALLSCPTGSIGTTGKNDALAVRSDFPLPIDGDVFYCGFNSPKSYGGNSYFVRHPRGNWLVDSPKFLPHLVNRFEAMGGLAFIFLTHQDDVADAERYAKHFKARRIIHREELDSQPDAEAVLDGTEPTRLEPGFLAIPTPGHTSGHCVLLYQDRFLFTGDHLWWNRDERRLGASRSYCWYSWEHQTESMARLREYSFEWVLPGHGQRVNLPAVEMHRHLQKLVERMRG